jgi:hypothetical protein
MSKTVKAKFTDSGMIYEYRIAPWINIDDIAAHLAANTTVYGIVTIGGRSALNNTYVTIVSVCDLANSDYTGTFSELVQIFTLSDFFEQQELTRKLNRIKELIKRERKVATERMELVELAKLSPVLADLLAQLNTLEGTK